MYSPRFLLGVRISGIKQRMYIRGDDTPIHSYLVIIYRVRNTNVDQDRIEIVHKDSFARRKGFVPMIHVGIGERPVFHNCPRSISTGHLYQRKNPAGDSASSNAI